MLKKITSAQFSYTENDHLEADFSEAKDRDIRARGLVGNRL